jgi:hypothetical protein
MYVSETKTSDTSETHINYYIKYDSIMYVIF